MSYLGNTPQTYVPTPVAAGGTGAENPADARSNLGLVIGVDVEARNPTILKSADIGVAVQAHDANTAKTNQNQSYTLPQRNTAVVANSGSFNLNLGNAFSCTPTAGFVLTFTNIPSGTNWQNGIIFLYNPSGYAISAAATTKISAANLTKISTAGTWKIGYSTDGTNVYVGVETNT